MFAARSPQDQRQVDLVLAGTPLVAHKDVYGVVRIAAHQVAGFGHERHIAPIA